MEKLFYTNKTAFSSSEDAVKYVLARFLGYPSAKVVKNEQGKPFIENVAENLFVSVSHTGERLFIAFADENVGVDAENTKRDVAYQPILKRFCNEERNAIQTKDDFLSLWTVKESAVKWLGGTLARDLKKLRYVDGVLQYDGIDVPVVLTQKRVDENIVTICCVRDFKNVEMVAFP